MSLINGGFFNIFKFYILEDGYRHKPGQNFHGKKNKRRALNIKFGLDKVL